MGRLDGKIAFVSGAARGIGFATAKRFVEEGALVTISDINGEAAERAAAELGDNAEGLVQDVREEAGWAEAIKQVTDKHGRLDILVNNAGIQFTAKVEDFPPERWDAILAINLTAVFHGCRAAVPGMKERGWGRIVNTASAHGLVASVEKSAYVAAKHGVVGLTKVVALETAEHGITCNSICPGWVRTAIVEQQIEARAKAKGVPIEEEARVLVGEKSPSRTFVTPEQIAALCLFLCSDAASQITGAAMTMDGGWTAQ